MDEGRTELDAGGEVEAEGLKCPLCEYDLRGLEEARCPECGGRFDWGELRDEGRHRLGWLFEHRRGIGGLAGTWVRLLWPWGLWGGWLKPVHRLVVGRVVGFWAVGVVLAVVVVGGAVVGTAVLDTQFRSLGARRLESRLATAAEVRTWGVPGRKGGTTMPAPTFADVNAANWGVPRSVYLDSRYPLWNTPVTPRSSSFNFLVRMELSRRMHQTAMAAVAVAAMPLAGLVVLGVMWQSFSRAKVKVGHGVRVALYSGDAGLFAVGFAVMCAVQVLDSLGYVLVPLMIGRTGFLQVMTVVVMAAWLTRFEAGVRQYLGVPRAWVVALATGAVGVLLMAVGMSWVFNGS